MKPIKLENFKLTHAIARRIAMSMWGRGGTSSYPTTRKGVWCFSCSSHGGYIVDPSALTAEEYEAINSRNVRFKYDLNLLVQTTTEGDMIIAIRMPFARPYKAKYFGGLGPVRWVSWEYFAFEEDTAWAVLVHETGITDTALQATEEHIANTVAHWHPVR